MQEKKNDLSTAIMHFWTTRDRQSRNQGSFTGRRDAGQRAAVTGGAQMDGFVELVKSLLLEAGIPDRITRILSTGETVGSSGGC